jgi:hypothetical protein
MNTVMGLGNPLKKELGNHSAAAWKLLGTQFLLRLGTVDTLGTHPDLIGKKTQHLVFSQQNTGKKSTQKLAKKGQEMHPETGQKSTPSRRFVLHKLVGIVGSQITIGWPAQSVARAVHMTGKNGHVPCT